MGFFDPIKSKDEAEKLEAADYQPRSLTVKIETDGGAVSYRIQELLASERNTLLFETGKLIGASSGALIKSYIDNAEEWQAVGQIVYGLYANATPEQLTGFIKNLISETVQSPANASEKFDEFFTRYYDHQWPLLAAIYEQNFGSSIAAIKKKLFASGLLTPKFSSPSSPEAKEQSKQKSKTASIKPNFANGKS